MNDVLARAACDFEDHALYRQDIAKDIDNEIAITQCRGRILAVVAHLPHAFPEFRSQDTLWSKSRRHRINDAGRLPRLHKRSAERSRTAAAPADDKDVLA